MIDLAACRGLEIERALRCRELRQQRPLADATPPVQDEELGTPGVPPLVQRGQFTGAIQEGFHAESRFVES
jgi:hypothetical protein